MNNYIGAHMASSGSFLFILKEQVTFDNRKHTETFVNPSEGRIENIITALFHRILPHFKITNLVESEPSEIRIRTNPNLSDPKFGRIRI